MKCGVQFKAPGLASSTPSSSKVTIFSRLLVVSWSRFWSAVLSSIGGGLSKVEGGGGGGTAISVTAARLNSLTLRGTKYSKWMPTSFCWWCWCWCWCWVVGEIALRRNECPRWKFELRQSGGFFRGNEWCTGESFSVLFVVCDARSFPVSEPLAPCCQDPDTTDIAIASSSCSDIRDSLDPSISSGSHLTPMIP